MARRAVQTFHRLTPRPQPRNGKDLVKRHYQQWSAPRHWTRPGFEDAIEHLKNGPAVFVETGSSAWGMNSTRLFASYARMFGGCVHTVDIRPEPSMSLKTLEDVVEFHITDSVQFLHELELENNDLPRFFYLDSWDVDWDDPMPSATHGLSEWQAVQRLSRARDVVVIDDTPNSLDYIPSSSHDVASRFKSQHGVFPGKGSLVVSSDFESLGWALEYHGYNVVLVRNRDV